MLGLGPPPDKLAAYTLDLLTYVKFGPVEVDQVPGEAQQLTFAQAQNEDQDVGRVQDIVVASRFQELACLINGPGTALACPLIAARKPDNGRRVPRDVPRRRS
jgi:hypothetical protein